MGIDAAGISGRVIFELAGESKNRREFVTGFFVKISVAHAVVEGTMAEADIRQPINREIYREIASYDRGKLDCTEN